MKLLFDQNPSPRPVDAVAEHFSESLHVQTAGLDRATDESVWRFALDHGFVIVSKDSDFQERSQVANSAPKVVWIQRGNCSTREIEAMLRENSDLITALEREPSTNFVVLL